MDIVRLARKVRQFQILPGYLIKSRGAIISGQARSLRQRVRAISKNGVERQR